MTAIDRAFRAGPGFVVPDGTTVFPLLNANDAMSGLPPGLLDDFSLAIGEIEAGSSSAIHVHPVVNHVTMVLDGELDVVLQAPGATAPVTVHLGRHEAALAPPGTYQQLVNRGSQRCRALYVVGPSYVFDGDADGVRYDDAVIVGDSWAAVGGGRRPAHVPAAAEAAAARAEAIARLHVRSPATDP